MSKHRYRIVQRADGLYQVQSKGIVPTFFWMWFTHTGFNKHRTIAEAQQWIAEDKLYRAKEAVFNSKENSKVINVIDIK